MDSFSLDLYIEQQSSIVSNALRVLLTWAVCNVLFSSFRLLQPKKSVNRMSFWRMILGWGLVNSAIAIWGIVFPPFDLISPNAFDVWMENSKLIEILRINTALDAGYMILGWGLVERGRRKTDDTRSVGFGKAIVVQGAFLFIFDLIFSLFLSRSSTEIESSIQLLLQNV